MHYFFCIATKFFRTRIGHPHLEQTYLGADYRRAFRQGLFSPEPPITTINTFRKERVTNLLGWTRPDIGSLTLQSACEKLGVDIKNSVYVGDSLIDARCAVSAGAVFVGVLSGGAHREDFEMVGATYVLDSISDLGEVFDKLG